VAFAGDEKAVNAHDRSEIERKRKKKKTKKS